MPSFHAISIGRGVVLNTPSSGPSADGCGVIAVGGALEFSAGPLASTAYVDAAIAAIELLPGPAGPTGATGATGPAGPNTVSGSTATALVGLLYGNGSNVAIASSANVVTALGYTPANRAGDTFTGAVTVTDLNTTSLRVRSGDGGTYLRSAANGDMVFMDTMQLVLPHGSYFGFFGGDTQWRRTAPNVTRFVGSDGFSLGTINVFQVQYGESGQGYIERSSGSLNLGWGFANRVSINASETRVATPLVVNNVTTLNDWTTWPGIIAIGGGYSAIMARDLAFQWNPSNTTTGGIADLGFRRAGAGVLEVNNGTAGSLATINVFQTQYGEAGQGFIERSSGALNLGWGFSTRVSVNNAVTLIGVPIRLGVYTVATLPSASANPSAIATVTDSSVTTNGSPVAGGGSNRVLVFSNGSTWDVVVA